MQPAATRPRPTAVRGAATAAGGVPGEHEALVAGLADGRALAGCPQPCCRHAVRPGSARPESLPLPLLSAGCCPLAAARWPWQRARRGARSSAHGCSCATQRNTKHGDSREATSHAGTNTLFWAGSCGRFVGSRGPLRRRRVSAALGGQACVVCRRRDASSKRSLQEQHRSSSSPRQLCLSPAAPSPSLPQPWCQPACCARCARCPQCHLTLCDSPRPSPACCSARARASASASMAGCAPSVSRSALLLLPWATARRWPRCRSS